MNSKCLLIVGLALFALASARPKNKVLNLGKESESEGKIREKRKYEIPLLQQMDESGAGVKRDSSLEEVASDGTEAGPSESADGEPKTPPASGPRVKKQSPNHAGGCGKTVCGPIVSARGPVVSDMRTMMQGGKPIISLGDLHSAVMSDMNDAASKVDRFSPLQGRTVDTIVAPIALGTLGYGTPAAYSAASPAAAVDLGHSFFKPPTVPAVAVIAAPHQPPNPLVHLMPHIMPHLMPHLMPSLMSSIGSFYAPHRWDPVRFPEAVQTDIKQPVPAFSPPSYSFGGENTLLCQPFRNQRVEGSFDYLYKPDFAVDKSINVTDGSKKSQDGIDLDEDRKIHEHLRKVNEIKEEISQLNRAAQRIVDQQEKLTAMQQKQIWGSSNQQSTQASEQLTNPYMGSNFYSHPAMPWGYSRSNILSYPQSQGDIDFFINLLRAGKKMGLLSDVVQPSVLSTIGEALKGVQDGSKAQKDTSSTLPQPEESKPAKEEKKSVK